MSGCDPFFEVVRSEICVSMRAPPRPVRTAPQSLTASAASGHRPSMTPLSIPGSCSTRVSVSDNRTSTQDGEKVQAAGTTRLAGQPAHVAIVSLSLALVAMVLK